jgi:hypothetical protein
MRTLIGHCDTGEVEIVDDGLPAPPCAEIIVKNKLVDDLAKLQADVEELKKSKNV